VTETGKEAKRFGRSGRVNEITARANRDIVAAKRPRNLVRRRCAPSKAHQGRVVHLAQRGRAQFGSTAKLDGQQASAHRFPARMPACQVADHRQRRDHPGNAEPLGHDASVVPCAARDGAARSGGRLPNPPRTSEVMMQYEALRPARVSSDLCVPRGERRD
jgi:hypothetical protein